MGLSNHALSLAAASPLLAVFEALPISIKVFAGLSVNDLWRPGWRGVRVMKTVRSIVSSARAMLRLRDFNGTGRGSSRIVFRIGLWKPAYDLPSVVDSILTHAGNAEVGGGLCQRV